VARQADLELRTAELTAFYSGQGGIALTHSGDDAAAKAKGQEKSEITRMEARRGVILTSKDQSASGMWADFNVKANNVLLGGGVTVTRPTNDPLRLDTITGDRLKVDLTTGVYQLESDPQATSPLPKVPPQALPAKTPAVSASPPATEPATLEEKVKACAPGRQCALIFPQQMKDKAIEALKKKTPAAE
jgi:lipopolysaccharide export system protein LptA